MLKISLCVFALAFAATIGCALGQTAVPSPTPSTSPIPVNARATVFASGEDSLRDRGVGIEASLVQYAQAMTAGAGNHGLQYGGKLIASISVDGAKVGLWKGFSFNIIPEYNYGHNVNGFGGTVFPVNVALKFPTDDPGGGDVSLTLTQSLGRNSSITVGKFDMIYNASRTPLQGGGGIDTFWYLNPASPVTGLVPAYLTGASLSILTNGPKYSFMVYDPSGAQQTSGLSGWGSDGLNERVSVNFPIRVGGNSGNQVLTEAATSRPGIDLSELAFTLLPPGEQPPIGTRKGGYALSYAFQQYLWQDKKTPTEGWGVFGQATKMDGNPTPYQWSFFVGIGGTNPTARRHLDRWGFVIFDTAFSSDLSQSLQLIKVNLGNESGAEAYYNAALEPWLRLAIHAQYIKPGIHTGENAFFAGSSLQVKL
jgi:porin